GSRPILKASCYAKHGGLMYYVTSTSKCSSSQGKINFAKDAPVYTCYVGHPVGVAARAAKEDRLGLMTYVTSPSKCHSYGMPLPRIGPRSFCVDAPTHRLRNLAGGYPCHKAHEFKVILRGTGPPSNNNTNPGGQVQGQSTPPVANNDSATTDE